jgi:hypothetical protein
MPSTRGAGAPPAPAAGLSGQFSINDLIMREMLGSGSGKAIGEQSYSVHEFANLMKDQLLHQHEQRYQAQAAAATAPLAAPPAPEKPQGGRARRKTSDGSAANSTGSGKTMDQIWRDINAPGAEVTGGGAPAGGPLALGSVGTVGRNASFLPTPNGSGALFGSLGMGSLGGGAPSLPLITQGSIDKLVSAHSARESKMPAKEWLELLLPNTAAGAAGGANAAGAAGAGGILPTLSAMRALEASAAAMETNAIPPPPGRGGRRAAKDAAAATTKPATTGRKRARGETDDAPRAVVHLPPKKKGRKKKGEVDTETEEEKALRAEERQRKNRESAARSHRKKAQMATELEQRAKKAEARVESLEKEVAKLKREMVALKGGAGAGGKATSPKGIKRASSAR